MILPFREPRIEIGRFQINRRIEFFQIRPLRSLHFAVQVGRRRFHGSEFNSVLSQPMLDRVGEELPAPIGLHPLNGKTAVPR